MGATTTRAIGSVGAVRTRYLDLPDPVPLDCGRSLDRVRVAYETYGELSPARDNVILVCHALSGDAHAAGTSATRVAASTRDGFAAEDRDGSTPTGLGWWDGMIGPGKAFDTDHYFVVSTNLLGGCSGTTGPSSIDPTTGTAYGSDFPVITVADMVRVERAFLDTLGIDRLAAVAGGSLGGMQALEWAVSHPDQVDSIVVIASTHALHPQGVAWNAIARQYGDGSLARALSGIEARVLLVAFSSDWLYPPSGSQEIHDALQALGRPVELHVIDAPYGHDCFLLEEARQTPLIRTFLTGSAS